MTKAERLKKEYDAIQVTFQHVNARCCTSLDLQAILRGIIIIDELLHVAPDGEIVWASAIAKANLAEGVRSFVARGGRIIFVDPPEKPQ